MNEISNTAERATQSWNMSNSAFKDLGTISTAITIDGLTLIADSERTMSVISSNSIVNGTEFKYALSLGGRGTTSYRSVSLKATGSSTLKITAKSSGSDTRYLAVVNAQGQTLGRITCAPEASLGTITFSGDQTVYIYSEQNGIYIYKVQLDTKDAEASSKSWNMSNTEFRGLGTISSSTVIDGLNLIATYDKTMRVTTSNATVGDSVFQYALSLEGSGSASYRSVALKVSGTSTFKITAKSSGSDTRILKAVDVSGTELASLSFSSAASLHSFTITKDTTVYLYSAGSGIYIYKIQLDTTGILPGNSVTVTTYANLVSAVKIMASTSGGGTVYINTSSMSCTEQLALSSTAGNPVSIVGIQQSDGTYPVLDFSVFRDSKIGSTGGSLTSSSDDSVGIRITGSNYTISSLIIQKAPDNGIQIKGSNANYNRIENCILRYNNDSGLQITGGASNNTIRFVYSYRNCDVYTRGSNADGFSPKLGATTGNTFYGCYAWDNADDAWDSYDSTSSGFTYDLSYEECAAWNNGNPKVFSGEYDFNNGNELDTDLFLVELIIKQDSSFASNYNNGSFSLPLASFINTDSGVISAVNWTGTNFAGNPNGFKFGSANSGADLKRTIKNCLSFDHGDKGFDNNNSSCTGSFENTVSFDNNRNYYIPKFTISKWSNVRGFSGASSDGVPSGYMVTTPDSDTQNSIRSIVTATRATIIANCKKNIILGGVYFNIF